MERLISALERRFARYAPAHIIWWLVGLSGIVYFLCLAKPELAELFILDAEGLRHGEVWRLITFLFMPWQSSGGMLGPVMTIFALLFLYTIGSSLEAQWGSFRFDLFYLTGALGTIAVALFLGTTTNLFINEALLLAFAIEFPDYQILLMLILPLKMRWVGLIALAGMLFEFVTGSWAERASIAVALGTLLLYCGADFANRLRGRAMQATRGRAMSRYRAEAAPPQRSRVCAKCGKSEKDDPKLEFRICSCAEKCGGRATEYCLAHARNH